MHVIVGLVELVFDEVVKVVVVVGLIKMAGKKEVEVVGKHVTTCDTVMKKKKNQKNEFKIGKKKDIYIYVYFEPYLQPATGL